MQKSESFTSSLPHKNVNPQLVSQGEYVKERKRKSITEAQWRQVWGRNRGQQRLHPLDKNLSPNKREGGNRSWFFVFGRENRKRGVSSPAWAKSHALQKTKIKCTAF